MFSSLLFSSFSYSSSVSSPESSFNLSNSFSLSISFSHSSNPFLIEQELLDNGFKMTDMKFFHFHSLPPLMKDIISEESEFYINSHNMEKKYSKSWLGNFMAFQFFVTAKKL